MSNFNYIEYAPLFALFVSFLAVLLGATWVLYDWNKDKELVESFLDEHLDKKVIVNCDRDPYLVRWFLVKRESLGIYIHKFIRSDEDRALHDHPWPFLVVPIWRGYIERNDKGERRVWPILGTRLRPATYRHRVKLLRAYDPVVVYADSHGSQVIRNVPRELPAWSVFIRFKRIREWGFWPKEGFIQWNKWWNDKCE